MLPIINNLPVADPAACVVPAATSLLLSIFTNTAFVADPVVNPPDWTMKRVPVSASIITSFFWTAAQNLAPSVALARTVSCAEVSEVSVFVV